MGNITPKDADAECNIKSENINAKLEYRAWLSYQYESDGGNVESQVDIAKIIPPEKNWLRRDNMSIGTTEKILVTGATDTILDELGNLLDTDSYVWTGTSSAGDATDNNCASWTNNTNVYLGTIGHPASAESPGWTNYEVQDANIRLCNNKHYIYCFRAF